MREIKLRAWDIEANDWAYGTLNIKRFRFDIKCDIYGQLVEGYGIDGLIKEETMSEYTGYKDINDVEIYEGDIVETTRTLNHIVGVVTMIKSCWYIQDEKDSYYRLIPRFGTAENKIIGNIYENKELIGGGIMEDRKLVYPAIYKHFKGKYYATMGISKPISPEKLDEYCLDYDVEIADILDLYSRYTEEDKYIHIFKIKNEWHHWDSDYADKLVLYKALYNDMGAYARPYDMFMSEVDKAKYPNVEQKYRFELVRY